MASSSRLSDLHKAKSGKKDEFYTQLEDIELEMKHYKDHFKGKTVFCNCDDPYESNFFKYFAMNFNYLGLKKLIATCYVSSPVMYTQLSLFDDMEQTFTKPADPNKKPYKVEITEVKDENGDGAFDLDDIKQLLKSKKNVCTVLKGNGDFRSDECIELLKEADIVVTNPPFSLFRDYVSLLMDNKKDFIIIGNVNALTYKEVFPYIKENKLWLGASIHSGDREFRVPDSYPISASGYRIDDNGIKYIRVKGVRWFTTLDYEKRHEELILYKTYNAVDYPNYENMKTCINVDKTSDIPCDYYDLMGVPITFMDKYNPDQFEIVGCADANVLPDGWNGAPARFIDLYYKQGNTGQYQEGNRLACYIDHDGNAKIPYKRIIIRRKEQPA